MQTLVTSGCFHNTCLKTKCYSVSITNAVIAIKAAAMIVIRDIVKTNLATVKIGQSLLILKRDIRVVNLSIEPLLISPITI